MISTPTSLVESPFKTKVARTAHGTPRVLVADDDVDMCEIARDALSHCGFEVETTTEPEQVLTLLGQRDYQVLLTDIMMGSTSGTELCRRAIDKHPGLLVIVMTGFGRMEHAIDALRSGAHDFITKPFSVDLLAMVLRRAIKRQSMAEELASLQKRLEERSLPNIVGASRSMASVADMVTRVATTDTTVLIVGESGTGKELVARAIHEKSGRKGAFLAINCAAVPETLLESELFGHARGAFTDARTSHTGLFVEAHEGTLFLDEISEMSLGMQAKLLRVLQERKVRPLGTAHEIPYDARLVAATNQDLDRSVQEGRFREDLFYRINVVQVELPPLRNRDGDILILAQYFLESAARRAGKQVTKFGAEVASLLTNYSWPGNVRELENCMERAVALARYDVLTVDDLPPKISERVVADESLGPEELLPMDVVEERYIRKVLEVVNGNKAHAARVLGFDRRTLYRKLERIDPGAIAPAASETQASDPEGDGIEQESHSADLQRDCIDQAPDSSVDSKVAVAV